jgi:hypothetical protein
LGGNVVVTTKTLSTLMVNTMALGASLMGGRRIMAVKTIDEAWWRHGRP